MRGRFQRNQACLPTGSEKFLMRRRFYGCTGLSATKAVWRPASLTLRRSHRRGCPQPINRRDENASDEGPSTSCVYCGMLAASAPFEPRTVATPQNKRPNPLARLTVRSRLGSRMI